MNRQGGNSLKRALVVVAVVAWTALAFTGCSDIGSAPVAPDSSVSNPPPQDGQNVSFQSQISPIFQRYGCYGCHGGSGGLFVTSVGQLLRGGDNGAAVIAGKADSSNLVRKLSSSVPFGDRMPQGGPFLADSTLQTIRLWINQGAKDN